MRTEKGKRQPRPQAADGPQRSKEHGTKDHGKDHGNKEYGEGNYKATRQYNDATKDFVQSGQVDEAASEAKPRNPQDQREMRDAEQAGREKSKGEDPKLYPGTRKSTDVE